MSDGELGLYTGPWKIAEERCKAGGEMAVGEGTKKTTSARYAVEAFDSVECPLLPIWVWEDLYEGNGPNGDLPPGQ